MYDVSATKFTKERAVSTTNVHFIKDSFVLWVPTSEGANDESKYFSVKALLVKKVNEIFVFLGLSIGSFLQCVGIILEGACYVDYEDFSAISNDEVGTVVARSVGDGLVNGNLSTICGFLETGDNFIMAGADGYHVGATVAQDVG